MECVRVLPQFSIIRKKSHVVGAGTAWEAGLYKAVTWLVRGGECGS